jgi:hypothetical protein
VVYRIGSCCTDVSSDTETGIGSHSCRRRHGKIEEKRQKSTLLLWSNVNLRKVLGLVDSFLGRI